MKELKLDAIMTPNDSAASVLAIGGMPGITVPAGYGKLGVPFGICFGGLKGYEPRLIEIAYAFEQATRVRKIPTFSPQQMMRVCIFYIICCSLLNYGCPFHDFCHFNNSNTTFMTLNIVGGPEVLD